MKKFLLSLLLPCSFLCASAQKTVTVHAVNKTGSSTVWPGVNDNIRNELPVCYDPALLQPISDELFAAGNYKYIFVDLLSDGLIESGKSSFFFLFSHEGDELLQIGSNKIPKDVTLRYVEKWKKFLKSINEPDIKTNTFATRTPINMEDITNPQSAFRHLTMEDVNYMYFRIKSLKDIYDEMDTDGFIKEGGKLAIEYKNNHFYFNGKKSTDAIYEKYTALYHKYLSIEMEFPEVSYNVSMKGFYPATSK